MQHLSKLLCVRKIAVSLTLFVKLLQELQLNVIYPFVNDSLSINDQVFENKRSQIHFSQKRNGLINGK